jgi:catechol 2,3-dioxygenase-like lactoylglutathione lyase family enzyme
METILRLTHVGIGVTDMDRAVGFYRDALGFTWEHELRMEGEPTDTLLRLRGSKLHAVYLTRDGIRIELMYFASPPAPPRHARVLTEPGLTHLSLRVVSMNDATALVRRHGGEVLEDTMLQFPELQTFACFVRDPDGQLIELIQAPGDPTVPPGKG